MKRKTEQGLSLVEVLATLTLLSIIIGIVFSIVLSSQKQNIEQTREGQQINDASYILKVITKDVRNTSTIDFSTSNAYLLDLHEDMQDVDYQFSGTTLYRNGNIIANQVNDFKIEQVVHNSFIKVSFQMNGQKYEASLSYRKGSSS